MATNPAKRLSSLITEATRISGKGPAREVWAKVFNTDSKSAEFLLNFAGLTKLLDATKQKIEELNVGATEINQLEVLRTALDPAWLNHAWDECSKRLEPAAKVYLSTCADILSHHMPETEISREDIEELQRDLEELQHRILEGNHEPNLKNFLLRQIEKARIAILHYRLYGTDPLESAIESILGAMLVPPEEIIVEEAKETEGFQRLWTWIRRVAQFIGLAEKIDKLSSSAPPGLLGGG